MDELTKAMSRRAGATGAAVAAGAVPYTFQRTLMTRGPEIRLDDPHPRDH